MDLFDVNWLAVVLAAACGFIVGGIWYGPVMGKKWMGAVGLTEEQIQDGNMGLVYGGAFAFSLLGSWTLAHTFASYATDLSVAVKVMTAFGVAIGFIIPALGTNYLFSQKGKTLFFIDAGYWILFYLAMGTVHAYLP
ncbi:DUF1761 domain-containing protein [Pontixanthobacter aestiaquae]|uniref:DUF1761 family protein n=1 Tax=Pontixanthobacter aestiaquae TaxID=1509367 RepID=A0A844Z526_9SPHN|nr:DUF1761 domain-containing protein [Pontixanthobacter aestiaquae]MDN3646170.1 DUF1761 domain-containing protein [Pontixanthobacter aestiaquae]MXO82838.1 DUF1761 family protein [Pontixanthobacter aestiaquae]